MYTERSTESLLIGILLILIWLDEREIHAFSSKGFINYDISTVESEDTMKSPILCLNKNVYDCSLNSEFKFRNSVLIQNNRTIHDCDILSIDANQDLLGVKQCIGIFINMNNTGKTSNYQIWLKNQDAVRLSVSKNVIYENLLTTNDISQSYLINETTSTLKFHSIRNSGIHVTVELSELNLYPAYEDVNYDGVNDVILNATPGTYAFRLKNPLMQVASHFCRYPLPSRYLLSLKAFRRRQTYGYKRNCSKHAQMNTTYCLTNKHENYSEDNRQKKSFYERSLNDQCGRNQAAILPDDPNSFYCTYDTPLINELFGEYVNEQILQSNISPCDTYENLCFKCLNLTIENVKTNSQCSSNYVNMNELSEINVNYDESESNVPDAQCCRISCYNTPACLSYYSSTCQSSKTKKFVLEDKVCMDGNTFQISITPEYDFHNDTFMCHLRQINNSFGFRLKFSLNLYKLVEQRAFQDQFNTRMLLSIASQHKINSYQKSKLIIKAFGLDISLNEPKKHVFQNFKDVILVGRKVGTSEGYEFFVHQAPSSSEIEYIQSPVEQVLHTDSAFTTLQSNRPHAFSSINWKEKGCVSEIFQNIRLIKVSSAFYSKGYPADIYAISNVKTDLAHSMSSRENNVYWDMQHKFQLNDKQTNLQRVNIRLSGNHSVLRPVFCDNKKFPTGFKLHTIIENKSTGQYRILRKALKASVKFVPNSSGQEILHILVTGYVTGTPTYLNLKLIWAPSTLILSNHDVVILNSQTKDYLKPIQKIEQFQLTYHLDIKSIEEIPYETLFLSSFRPTLIFDLVIQDCHSNVAFRIYNPLLSQRIKDTMLQGDTVQTSIIGIYSNKSAIKESSQWMMFSPLLFITIGVGLLYFLVLIVFVFIKHFIIPNKGYPISFGYQTSGLNDQYGDDLQYHQLLLHAFPVKINNRTLYYVTSRKGEDYIQAFPPSRPILYHPTIVAHHRYHHYVNKPQHYQKFSSNSSWLSQNTWNMNNSQIKRIFLFTHLAFRVFYTFLFTFSVAVSLIFSLQPSGRISSFDSILRSPKINSESVDLTMMQNNIHSSSSTPISSALSFSIRDTRVDQIHLIGPILRLQAEARWIEEFTEQELRRQLDYVERMKLACQHAMTVELTDALREGRHLVKSRLEKWQFNITPQNTDNLNDNTIYSVNELANHHFNRQSKMFDHVYEQVSQKFDFRNVESYKIYANILSSVFHSGWLQYVKRMLNTSDNLERNPKHFSNNKVHSDTKLNFHDSMRRYYEIAQQKSGIKASYVALMNYMNFYQADSIHLLPLQLLENLKKAFTSPNYYRSMFHLLSEISSQSESKFKNNHQIKSSKSLHTHKTQQERIFLTTNDLEEHADSAIYSIGETLAQESFNKRHVLISENFIQYIKQNAQQNTQNHLNYLNRRSMLPVMTLTHIRLSLLILDCFIIAYRFFHTYEILKAFWTGQTLFVDASSWLEKQTHTTVTSEKHNGDFHEVNKTPTEPFNSYSFVESKENDSCLHLNYVDYNEILDKQHSRTALSQCLPQHQKLYECRHEQKGLFPQSIHSPGMPRNSQSSETTSSSIVSNKIIDSQSERKSKQHFQFNPSCKQLLQIPCETFPFNSVISIGPPLCLPPSSSFGIEQNTSCILGIRTSCCRKSHYISSVIGSIVIVLLFSLVLMQMYKPYVVMSKKSSKSTLSEYTKQSNLHFTSNKIPYLSTEINFFRPYHELLIRNHSKRLNEDWLEWTKHNELSMRRRVLNYLSRFKHELNYFDQQMETENSIIQSVLSSMTKSDKFHTRPTKYPTSPVFNSEFLFRQQICHFLPVISTPLSDDSHPLNKEGDISSLHKTIRPHNIKRIIWTATISTFVDFDWNSEEQANNLFITAIIVGIVMISCIGVVDIGGKILKMLYINPAISISEIRKCKNHSKRSNETEESKYYDRNIENIILISPQPAPIIPWPTKLLLNVNDKVNPVSEKNSTNQQTSLPESLVAVHKDPEPQLPLTAFYLDSSLVLTSNSTTPIFNNKTIRLDDISHSLPVFIAHSPSSTPIIALKADNWASTDELSGVFVEKHE